MSKWLDCRHYKLPLVWPVSIFTCWALWCCLKLVPYTLWKAAVCQLISFRHWGLLNTYTPEYVCVYWRVRHTLPCESSDILLGLGKRQLQLTIQSEFRISQNKALGPYSHSNVSLSMCLCVTDPLPADHTSHILPHGEDLPASRPRTGICLPSMPVLTWHLMIWYG